MALGFRGFRRNPLVESGFKPFEQTFNYTGSMQFLIIPYSGLYKIELYGAQGGSSNAGTGGRGGYTIGYREASKNETWYIGVGGQGGSVVNGYGSSAGGWNGGGNGNGGNGSNRGGYHAGGGGASHVGLVNDVLRNTPVANLFAVAGGGGGGSGAGSLSNANGGTGGGNSGGNGSGVGSGAYYGTGATQSAGGSAVLVGIPANQGGYGYGGTGTSPSNWYCSANGGGGGYYGGGGGRRVDGDGNGFAGGGGGSGYIGGVPAITYGGITYSPSMSNNVQSSDGKVVITRIA